MKLLNKNVSTTSGNSNSGSSKGSRDRNAQAKFRELLLARQKDV